MRHYGISHSLPHMVGSVHHGSVVLTASQLPFLWRHTRTSVQCSPANRRDSDCDKLVLRFIVCVASG